MNLVLLIFLVSISISIGSITSAAKKYPKQVVKDVGKRFVDTILGGSIQKIKWNFMSDEEFNRTKLEESEKVGLLIQVQSSTENWSWKPSAAALESLMSSYFEASICGGPKLNYVQFLEYWARKRLDYRRNVVQQPIQIAHLPTDSYTLSTFTLSFNMNSKFEYQEQAVYMVQLELRGKNEANSYTIMSINEIAPCTDYGKIDWLSKYALGVSIKDGEPGEEDIIKQYVEKLFKVNETASSIPDEWIGQVAAKGDFFNVTICENGAMRKLETAKFRGFWDKFGIMWHPAPRKWFESTVQLMGGTKGRYVFRVTLHLQLGTNVQRESQEWNFRVQMEYNVHGDEMWYMNHFEVLCPVYSEKKLMEQHAEVYKEMLADRMDKIIVSRSMWYTCTQVFDNLIAIGKPVEFESCTGTGGQPVEKSTSLADLEHKFWQENKVDMGQMIGYNLGREHESSLLSETMLLHIFAIWPPRVKDTVHESKWSFNIQWNVDYQFFEIIKIVFNCPAQDKGNKEYARLPLDFLDMK